SPPARVPRARQISLLTVCLTARTEASAKSTLTRPEWRLDAVWAPSLSGFFCAPLHRFGGMAGVYRAAYILPLCHNAPTQVALASGMPSAWGLAAWQRV